MAKIMTNVSIDLENLAASLGANYQVSDTDLIEFILRIDEFRADLDFTKALTGRLQHELVEELERS